MPQTNPSLHVVFGAPWGQKTSQLPVLTQCTRQEPLQVTSQAPTEVQYTSLPSPTRGVQLLTLVQSY